MSRSGSPVAVVTGGSSGIGLETAVGLAERGFDVVLPVRSPVRGEQARATIRERTGAEPALDDMDLESLASVRAFAQRFLDDYPGLDVLVNNAGVAGWGGERVETVDGFERSFGVNHLGHFLLTTLLTDALRARGGRVVTLTSEFGYQLAPDGLDWDDLQTTRDYDGVKAYGRSKLSNIYFAIELARRLADSGATSNCVCPGYVATHLGSERTGDEALAPDAVLGHVEGLPEPRTPAEGAKGPLFLATDPEVAAVTGRFFRGTKVRDLRPPADDAEAPARLWELSERLVGSATS